MKDIMKEKPLAMIVLLVIALASLFTLGVSGRDIVIPIVTGICSFVTGYELAKRNVE